MPPPEKQNGPGVITPEAVARSVASQATITVPETTPRAPGRLQKSRRGAWLLVVLQCPFCRKTHQHGAPAGPETREESRVSHCHLIKPRTYRIVVEGPA